MLWMTRLSELLRKTFWSFVITTNLKLTIDRCIIQQTILIDIYKTAQHIL